MKAEEILKKCGLTRKQVENMLESGFAQVRPRPNQAFVNERVYRGITAINRANQITTASEHMSYGVRFGSNWEPTTTYGG